MSARQNNHRHAPPSQKFALPKYLKSIAPDDYVQKVQSTFNALRFNFQAITSHPAVTGDDLGEASIKSLEQIINRSRPATDPEKWIAATIMALTQQGPDARTSFLGFMMHTRSRHLSQMINGSSIHRFINQNKFQIVVDGDEYKIERSSNEQNAPSKHTPGGAREGLSQEACAQVLADISAPPANSTQQSYRDVVASRRDAETDDITIEVINVGSDTNKSTTNAEPKSTNGPQQQVNHKQAKNVPRSLKIAEKWADVSDDEKSSVGTRQSTPTKKNVPTSADVEELNSTLEELLK